MQMLWWPDVFLIYKVSIVYSRDGNAAHWGFDTASQVVTFLLTNHAPFSETLICILKTSNVLWMSACFSFQCDIVNTVAAWRQTGHSAEGKAQLEIASSTITPNTTTALHCHSMHCHLEFSGEDTRLVPFLQCLNPKLHRGLQGLSECCPPYQEVD